MDAAAKQFSEAFDADKTAMEFVNEMRKKGQLIMGIGHRVKSVGLFLSLQAFLSFKYEMIQNVLSRK